MTFEEFVKNTIEVPDEWRMPFCPFYGKGGTGYCDVAYTSACYMCIEAEYEYETLCKEK